MYISAYLSWLNSVLSHLQMIAYHWGNQKCTYLDLDFLNIWDD